MGFDIICFGEATPGTGTVALAGGLGETHYYVSADDIMCKARAPWLLGAYFSAESTGGIGHVRQPSLRCDHEFHKVGLLADNDPAYGYSHLFGRPLPMKGDEKINVLLQNATDEDAVAALLLGSGKITQAMLDAVNPTHAITALADTTVTAFTWSALTLTWSQDLPAGRYAIVGMKFGYFTASPAAAMPAVARVILTDNPTWRPGVVGIEAQADHEEVQTASYHPWSHWPLMREVSFTADQMPNIEVFSGEATTDENIELLLQKIA